MRKNGISVRRAEADRSALDNQGYSCIYVAIDGTLAGLVPFTDQIRPESREIIERLHGMGIRNSVMLTGDNAVVARAVCRGVGLTREFAEMLPADKAEVIQNYQRQGNIVAMVGDGINDAGALAQADAGIAMGTGADLAQEAGDVLLLRATPSAIPAALDLARATLGVMRQNLIWAAVYNVLGIPLAAGLFYPAFHILLSPWLAAAAMAFSSVSVLANSLRLRRWQPPLIEATTR